MKLIDMTFIYEDESATSVTWITMSKAGYGREGGSERLQTLTEGQTEEPKPTWKHIQRDSRQ